MTGFASFVGNVIRGGKPSPPHRMSPGYLMNLMAITVIVMIVCIEGVLSFWTLGFTTQVTKCLPGDAYLVTKIVPQTIRRGETIAYRSQGLAPLLPDGATVIKKVAAVPGDVVSVNGDGVWINGSLWGPLNEKVLRNTGRTIAQLERTFVVRPGELVVLGTLPRSYDSRYWGPIRNSQLIGTARNLW